MNLEEKVSRAISLLKKRAIDDYEVFGMAYDTIRAESKDAGMGFLNHSRESGIGIRVLNKRSIGFAYGADPDESLIDSAVTSARHQFEDPCNHIPGPKGDYDNIDLFDEEIALLGPDACMDRAILLETSAHETDTRVDKVRKASFSKTLKDAYIVNSNGISVSGRTSSVSASIMVAAKDGQDSQAGYDFDFSHRLKDIDIIKTSNSAVAKATDMLNARRLKTMKIPVVFDNTTTSMLLEFISDAFLGENVMKGKSYLKDKLGKTCFSDNITLNDNPLDTLAASAMPFDGEGMPSQDTVLVKDGIVRSFVYDSYWAKAAGTLSTGNSIRGSFRSFPCLGIRHMSMNPGNENLYHTLKKLKQVLRITDIMGMHTANPITGEFSVGVNGVLYEQGDRCYPVRESAISGNIYELLSRVIMAGDDLREFGDVLCPSILIDRIDISSR